MRRPARAGAVIAAAVVIVAALALAASAPATAYRQTFLQLNLCGNACNRGGLAVVTALQRSIRERAPLAVTLNEVCENQYERLRAGLADYDGRFDPTGVACRNGARYGNAILLRSGRVSPVGSWPLPNPAGDELRRLVCLRARPAAAPPLVVCATHVSTVDGNIAEQVAAVADHLAEVRAEGALLLGGDFNTDPADARMSPLYRRGPAALAEADSGGRASRAVDELAGRDVINEDTFGRHKFDYIFLSGGDWFTPVADADDALHGLSDHDALWATATPRPV